MPMIKKSITVTGVQNDWIKSQMASGGFGNESEVIRDLIRDRQIRLALIEAEQSGQSDMTVSQIWEHAKELALQNG